MTRTHHFIDCEGEQLAVTLDGANGSTGLLIVSGGNEIRSGAHSGMAQLADDLAKNGFPVLRYDRRGIGESSGTNLGFSQSLSDISSATAFFRDQVPQISTICAFGNCDAATALALFGPKTGIDRYILANPWVIEAAPDIESESTSPPPSAIRARYWDRIKNPRTILDLLSGQIDLKKLLTGLKRAAQKQKNSSLSLQLRDALLSIDQPTAILLAERDTTARAFLAAWDSKDFDMAKKNAAIDIAALDSASHSFADETAREWLYAQVLKMLKST
ncbi:hydrolase 1, exosortase A system-associated [Sphingomonadales bacterium EhC05]|nr:hydrolase 1, exosortase A system-associated [Sphingomonadales bacterium EhC05]